MKGRIVISKIIVSLFAVAMLVSLGTTTALAASDYDYISSFLNYRYKNYDKIEFDENGIYVEEPVACFNQGEAIVYVDFAQSNLRSVYFYIDQLDENKQSCSRTKYAYHNGFYGTNNLYTFMAPVSLETATKYLSVTFSYLNKYRNEVTVGRYEFERKFESGVAEQTLDKNNCDITYGPFYTKISYDNVASNSPFGSLNLNLINGVYFYAKEKGTNELYKSYVLRKDFNEDCLNFTIEALKPGIVYDSYIYINYGPFGITYNLELRYPAAFTEDGYSEIGLKFDNIGANFYGDKVHITANRKTLGKSLDGTIFLNGYNDAGELVQRSSNNIYFEYIFNDTDEINTEYLFGLEDDVVRIEIAAQYQGSKKVLASFDREFNSEEKEILLSTEITDIGWKYANVSITVDGSDVSDTFVNEFMPSALQIIYRPIDSDDEWDYSSYYKDYFPHSDYKNFELEASSLEPGTTYEAVVEYVLNYNSQSSDYKEFKYSQPFTFTTLEEANYGTYAQAFPDAGFRSYITYNLRKQDTDLVYASDLENVYYLNLYSSYMVFNLKGMDLFPNLRNVNITDTYIGNLDDVDFSKLQNLVILNLNGNTIYKFPDLSACSYLYSVNFSRNSLSPSEVAKIPSLLPKGCTFSADDQNYEEIIADAELDGYFARLSDAIEFVFCAYIDDLFFEDDSYGACIVVDSICFDYSNEEVKQFEDEKQPGRYLIPCKIAPAMLSDWIEFYVYKDDENIIESHIQFEKYCKTILEGDEYSDTAKELVRALLNYGTYAQKYFDYNNYDGWYVNRNVYTDDTNPVLKTNAADIINTIDNKYKISEGLSSKSGGQSNFATYYGTSLVCENKLGFNIYFTLKDGVEPSKIKATVSPNKSVDVVAENVENNVYRISIENISICDLADVYEVELVYENGDSEAMAGQFSPMMYIKKALNNKDTKLVDLVKSIYLYYEAGMDYALEQAMEEWETEPRQ